MSRWPTRNIASVTALVLLALARGEEAEDRVVTKVSDAPRLHLVEDFATDAEMDHIMEKAFDAMKPQNINAETGMVTELPVGGSDILKNVYNRMSSVFPGVGRSTTGWAHDTFRVRRYLQDGVGITGGDYHPPHTDWFSSTPGDTSHVLIISMILYLTSPEKGGTTLFPAAWVNGTKGYHFQPKRGSLAAWWSCHTNGTQDFDSSHESTPVTEGIKWNAARFFYDNTVKCSEPSAKTIKAPVAARSLRDQGHSSTVMFGNSFPKGVWTSPEGTNHEGATPRPGAFARNRSPHTAEITSQTDVYTKLAMAKTNPVEVAQKRIAKLRMEL